MKLLEQYWFGPEEGLDADTHPFLMGEKKCPYLKNVNLSTDETIKWACGDITIGGPWGNPAASYSWKPIHAIIPWYDIPNNNFVVHVHAGNHLWHNDDADPYLFNWVPMTQLSLADVATHWALTSCYNISSGYSDSSYAIGIVGIEPYTNQTYPNLVLWNCSTQGDPFTVHSSYAPNWITSYQGRLWITEPPARLRWSNIEDGAVFDPSNYLEVQPEDGDRIVAVVPLRSIEPRLIIFKQRSIYLFDVVWSNGALIPTTENSIDTTNSAIKILSKEIGCIAPRTIQYVSGSERADIFFLSEKGVYSILRLEQDIGGGLSEPLSRGIQKYIDRITPSAIHKAVAAVHDNKYYLAVPLDGATENSAILVFDLVRKRWETFLDKDVQSFLRTKLGNKEYLFGALYSSNVSTPEVVVTTSSGATLLSNCWPVVQIGALSPTTYVTMPGVDYTFQVHTPLFNLGVPNRAKRWKLAELYYHYEPVGEPAVFYIRARTSRDSYTTGDMPLLTHFTLSSAQFHNTLTINLADLRPSEYIQFDLYSFRPFTLKLLGARVVGHVQEDIWE